MTFAYLHARLTWHPTDFQSARKLPRRPLSSRASQASTEPNNDHPGQRTFLIFLVVLAIVFFLGMVLYQAYRRFLAYAEEQIDNYDQSRRKVDKLTDVFTGVGGVTRKIADKALSKLGGQEGASGPDKEAATEGSRLLRDHQERTGLANSGEDNSFLKDLLKRGTDKLRPFIGRGDGSGFYNAAAERDEHESFYGGPKIFSTQHGFMENFGERSRFDGASETDFIGRGGSEISVDTQIRNEDCEVSPIVGVTRQRSNT